MSEIYESTNLSRRGRDEEELVKSHRKLMDSIAKPETVSKLLEWFGKEDNLKHYGKPPNTMFHTARGAQTGQNVLPLIVKQDKQRAEFMTFLVDRRKTEKDAAITSVKAAMETGPDLVKMMSAIEEKFPITSVGKWTNICVG